MMDSQAFNLVYVHRDQYEREVDEYWLECLRNADGEADEPYFWCQNIFRPAMRIAEEETQI